MSTTVPQTLAFRGYQEGDEAQILELFAGVFGREASASEWRWKFQDNPYAAPQAHMAWQADGALAAHYAVMPLRFNVMGKPVLASQSLDTMVRPSQRRRGLFEKTAAACYEGFVEAGGALVFGFPNEHSYPGFLRKLQWKRICYLREYSLRLGVRQLASTVHPSVAGLSDLCFRAQGWLKGRLELALLDKRAGANLRFCTSTTAPDGLDELWDAIRSYAVFSVWKDRTYMSWRYDGSTRNSFEYAYLCEGDRIAALAVLSPGEGGSLYIADILVRDRALLKARRLLAQIAQVARQQGYDKLVFIGADAGFYDALFDAWTSQIATGLILCARPFALEQLSDMFIQPHSWDITLGDTDAI